MKTTTLRRISQILFFALFLWFCAVTVFGEKFHQLRGWPVNWFLHLDPLAALGTLLTTHTFYWPFLWALGVVVVTILVGRFFCSWMCPFGTIHHFIGRVGKLGDSTARKIEKNKFRKAQSVKYYILFVFLLMAAVPPASTSLQIGLLDPIPLVTRSFNLLLLPLADNTQNILSPVDRYYETGGLILGVFFAFVALNLWIPRFFCRFVCPLGALFGVLDRFAIWRIGKTSGRCADCHLCEKNCEGGCEPTRQIRISECVLCFNCVDDCRHGLVKYRPAVSAQGEQTNPDVSRRGVLLSVFGGLAALPAVRLAARTGQNWYYKVIRPPGALPEEEFLKRCIKCGQCMKVCPTNVIQPGSIEGGLENLWTPVLNNRIGTSGCQLTCTACGFVCPTAAIRPITLSEKLGLNEFSEKGPIKLGTAFVDHGRCLPWSMNTPCIVCQENCPVSPKAIYTQEVLSVVRGGRRQITSSKAGIITISGPAMKPGEYATGDYYCRGENDPAAEKRKIISNTEDTLTLDTKGDIPILNPGDDVLIEVRLQRPVVDIEKCIGCGVCEHECPVSGQRAIRVSAEGETRSHDRRLLLGG